VHLSRPSSPDSRTQSYIDVDAESHSTAPPGSGSTSTLKGPRVGASGTRNEPLDEEDGGEWTGLLSPAPISTGTVPEGRTSSPRSAVATPTPFLSSGAVWRGPTVKLTGLANSSQTPCPPERSSGGGGLTRQVSGFEDASQWDVDGASREISNWLDAEMFDTAVV
jgi:hypothetical protein